jgi:hypothetical protein
MDQGYLTVGKKESVPIHQTPETVNSKRKARMDSSQPNRPPLETPEHSSAPSSRTQGLKDAATGPEGFDGPPGHSIPVEESWQLPLNHYRPVPAEPSFGYIVFSAGITAALVVLWIVVLGSFGFGPGAFFLLLWAGIAFILAVLLYLSRK